MNMKSRNLIIGGVIVLGIILLAVFSNRSEAPVVSDEQEENQTADENAMVDEGAMMEDKSGAVWPSVLKVYFQTTSTDPTVNCGQVTAVARGAPKSVKVATEAIGLLLGGPAEEEKNQGYITNIPDGAKLNSITIVEGRADVDFSSEIESGGGSCSMEARIAQIKETLLQFPTVTDVKISVDGRTENIFQP